MEPTFEDYEDCANCDGFGTLEDVTCMDCRGSGIVSPRHFYAEGC